MAALQRGGAEKLNAPVTSYTLDREKRAELTHQGQRHADVFLLRGVLGLPVKGTSGYLSADIVKALAAFQKQNPPLRVTGQADAATWQKLKETSPKAFSEAKFQEAEAVLNQVKTDSTGAPMFEQSDPRWGQVKVGTSTTKTLSQVGCGVSSLAAAVSRLGGKTLVTPDELNGVLREAGAFAKGANLNFKKASDAIFARYGVQLSLSGATTGLISEKDGVASLPADSGKTISKALDAQLAAGLPAVLRVDNNGGELSSDHFVLVTRKVGDKYMVLDPGVGQERPYAVKDGLLQAEEAYYPQKGGVPSVAPVAVGYVPAASMAATE